MAKTDLLAELLATAEKKYNIVAGPMNQIADKVTFISTGNLAIDYMLGGGIPLGRSVELSGFPSSGKTTTALQAAVSLQKIILRGGDPDLDIRPDHRILYMDYEQAMDKDYAKALGLDTDDPSFIYSAPDSLEDGADFILAALDTGYVKFVIVDSVPAMIPNAVADNDVSKSLPAAAAKSLAVFGKKLNPLLAHNNASVVFINHLMEKIEMGGGRRPGMPPATTTPGGMALKYFASVRVEYKQMKQHKGAIYDKLSGAEVEAVTSTDVRVKSVKNKVAPPFREAIVRVRFGKGFDNFWTAMNILISNKLVMYQTGHYYFHKVDEKGLAPEWMKRAATGTQRPYIKGDKALIKSADKYPEWEQGLVDLAREVLESDEYGDPTEGIVVDDETGEVED